MFFIHFLIALIMALAVMLVTRGFRRRGPWPAMWPLVVIILLTSWAGGMWITPVGPTLWGAPLLPFAAAAILIALFFAALPKRPQEKIREEETQVELVTSEEQHEREHQDYVLGWVFWFLAVLLMLAIIIRYLLFPPTVV
ncbi:MAG: hypothetical protein ACOCWR_01940 [Oceanidesulfovibrio sp.]